MAGWLNPAGIRMVQQIERALLGASFSMAWTAGGARPIRRDFFRVACDQPTISIAPDGALEDAGPYPRTPLARLRRAASPGAIGSRPAGSRSNASRWRWTGRAFQS